MRNIQRLTIFLFLISLCNAQIRVAVIDFEAKGVSEIEVSALTDRLRDELFKTGQYKVMERAMMEEILDEQGFQVSGCTSDECVIEMGKLIGVEQIIGGSISKVGNVFSVSSRMISVETGEVSRVANYDFTGDIGTLLTQGMKNAAIQLATGKAIESEQVIKTSEGTGILYITSEPSGAEVWIDNKKVEGATPLIVENQPEGKYKIYLCKGDYEGEIEVDLHIDDLKKVNITLQLGSGNLKIITKPFEAEVTIDGKPAGKSPLVLKDLKAGKYKLLIYKDGYSPLSTEIFIKANQTVEFKETLQKLATVKIISIPENATVIFDGEVIGSTPLTRETDSGIHILSIRKTGYYTKELDVDLKPDERKELQINLEKHKGGLNITSNPSEAIVSINGEIRGKTPITLDSLHIGNYLITIVKSYYVPLYENVNIETDSITSFHADLLKKPSFFTLTSDPSGAVVIIDEKYFGTSPVSKQIDPGSHHVTVRMADYYTEELDVELKPDEKKELQINLEKHNGGLNITSNPSGAIVSINGDSKGQTPITLDGLSVGDYLITIEKSDYIISDNMVIIEVDSIKNIHIELLKKPSFFTLTSNPSGAVIIIDEKYFGTSPVSKQIAPGSHHVTVKMADYYTKEFDVELKPDEKKELLINLDKHKGGLNITSNPSEAIVSINGETRGQTPINLDSLSVGNYHITIEKSDYVPLDKNIIIEVDSIKSIHADLLKKPSSFTLTSYPSGAVVNIDGKYFGKSPFSKQIAPGSHHVIVKMANYYTKEFDIELKPGEKKETQINLKRHVGILKVVTNPNGAKVKLDGKPVGNSPIVISNLLTGKYEVEIRKNNHLTLKNEVNITVDKEKLLDFKLTEFSFGKELQSLKMKKYVCLGAGILCSAAGAYFKYSSDKHYDEYLTAHDNATDLHDKIKLEDTIYPIAFGIGVACLAPSIYLHIKEISVRNKFNLSVTPQNDGIKLCVALEW